MTKQQQPPTSSDEPQTFEEMLSLRIAAQMHDARKAKSITLRELARRTCISHQYLSRLERCQYPGVTAITLARISAALGIRFEI